MAWDLAGVVMDSAGIAGGTELTPAALRECGNLGRGAARDHGDLLALMRDPIRDPISGLVGHADMVAATQTIRHGSTPWINPGRRVVVLGGCCTLMIGLGAATRDKVGDFGIAYLDGHLDLYDGHTSPSGEGADVPLATMLGHGDPEVLRAAGGASVKPENVYLLGYRDALQAEGDGSLMPSDFGPGFHHADTATIRTAGGAKMGDAVGAFFKDRGLPFWLFVDVDVLDPKTFSATDAMIGDGLDWAEIGALAGPLSRSPNLLGVVATCYNPQKDSGAQCGRALGRFLERAARGAL